MDETFAIKVELEKAEQSRLRGNEGRARVCARRAAGLAARQYIFRSGQIVRTSSAYDLLQQLTEDTELPQDIRQAAAYLTLRVDEHFKLPVEVDLILEATKLCAYLNKDHLESKDPKDPIGL